MSAVSGQPRRRSGAPGDSFRRSPTLVLYWRPEGPVAFDCRTGIRSPLTLDLVEFISALGEWRTADELAAGDTTLGSARDVGVLLEALAERGLVQRQRDACQTWLWDVWNPEAAFFHFATRNGRYSDSPREHDVRLREKARVYPQPAPTKSLPGRRRRVESVAIGGSLHDALHARRTWRQFARRPVPVNQVAALLQMTFGVQRRGTVEGQGQIVLKTSPSGGARHSTEAYLLALNVKGLRRGVYHYDADSDALVDLERPVEVEAVAYALANQHWFARAGALVVMAAVFERVMWRYPFSRAYRTVLTEAGHLGQTFCLVATALNLAPFCTMAFRDRELETIIGVDGISESAMYVVGVGGRPGRIVSHPGKIPFR